MKAAPSARQPDGQGLGKQGHGSRGSRACLAPEARERVCVSRRQEQVPVLEQR